MPGRAPPLPSVVVFTLVGRALFEGQVGLAAALALAYAAFLRTGEMLGARFQHVAIVEGQGTLALPLTKIGKRRGHQEFVAFEDPISLKLLQTASYGRYRGDTIIAVPSTFRTWWKRAIVDLGLDPEIYRPYGFRRGGATEFYRRTGSLEATLFRGRWSSLRTARAYIVEGMSLLAQGSIDLRCVPGARLYLQALRTFLAV